MRRNNRNRVSKRALEIIPPILVALAVLGLWFGNGIPAKVVMAALICFFPVIVNTTKGLQTVSPAALDLFGSLSASRWQVLWKLRFPMALPYIFSALDVEIPRDVKHNLRRRS